MWRLPTREPQPWSSENESRVAAGAEISVDYERSFDLDPFFLSVPVAVERAACCSRGGFRRRSRSPKLLATSSVWFSGWNEGSLGCSEVRLSGLPCSGWR
jgi:hypothetical protein